ncbi:Inner membrane protein YohC [invertebrate metagenome]|uniref:Inner membrane protein YohC n=1 Tax=invertebrate metagenome TaxID=1711999 RepID=A0A2H9TAH9_9ZZZZ
MIIGHLWGLIVHPEREWKLIRKESHGFCRIFLGRILWLPAIPAVSTWYGTTQVGWRISDKADAVRLSTDSALWMAVLGWLAISLGIVLMGGFIQWMSKTYGTRATYSESLAFSCYAAYPLLLSGLAGVWPAIWVLMLVALTGIAMAVWLLFSGLPYFMEIPEERAFIYASSVLCVGLVMVVALMMLTVVLWGAGMGPVYR